MTGPSALVWLGAAVVFLLIGGIAFAATRGGGGGTDQVATSPTTVNIRKSANGSGTTPSGAAVDPAVDPTVTSPPDIGAATDTTVAPADGSTATTTSPAVGGVTATTVAGRPFLAGPPPPTVSGGGTSSGPVPAPGDGASPSDGGGPAPAPTPPPTPAPIPQPSVSISATAGSASIAVTVNAQQASRCVLWVSGNVRNDGACGSVTITADKYFTNYADIYVRATNDQGGAADSNHVGVRMPSAPTLGVTVNRGAKLGIAFTTWHLFDRPDEYQPPISGVMHEGDPVTILCQRSGPSWPLPSPPGGGTKIYDFVRLADGKTGWSTDAFTNATLPRVLDGRLTTVCPPGTPGI